MSRRGEFEKATVFDWHGTLTESDRSKKPRKSMLKKVEKADDKGDVVILTSSPEKGEVKDWLKDHDVDYDKLVTRPKGNKEPDYRVKQRLFNEDVTSKYKVSKVYDDKGRNVKMFKDQGVKAEKV